LVGRKGIWPVKMGDGGGGHWLVQMEWHLARWSVSLPLLIFPCTIKSRSFSSGTGSPGWSRKKDRETVVVVVVVIIILFLPADISFKSLQHCICYNRYTEHL